MLKLRVGSSHFDNACICIERRLIGRHHDDVGLRDHVATPSADIGGDAKNLANSLPRVLRKREPFVDGVVDLLVRGHAHKVDWAALRAPGVREQSPCDSMRSVYWHHFTNSLRHGADARSR